MEANLAERKGLVVGASGGMGSAVAVALAREGVACALMGRDHERLTETAKACAKAGTEATSVVCDIAKSATIEGAVSQAIQALDGLSYLINCAGTYQAGKAYDVDLDAWDRMLDVNLRAHYHLVRHALPEINKTPGGAVVKIGSISVSYSGAGLQLATRRGLDVSPVSTYGTELRL
jgi:NADP-dependent 3-hydroxy acid dehydrogenase YdfG